MILVLYDDKGTVLGIIPEGKVRGDEIWIGDRRVASGIHCNWAYVPDQDVSHLYVTDETGGSSIQARYPDDFTLFTPKERAALIDRKTGENISEQIHPHCPTEEQIGILRDQLVHVLHALGIEPTEEFARLNEIAIKEIEAAREKKEMLNAQDDTA